MVGYSCVSPLMRAPGWCTGVCTEYELLYKVLLKMSELLHPDSIMHCHLRRDPTYNRTAELHQALCWFLVCSRHLKCF